MDDCDHRWISRLDDAIAANGFTNVELSRTEVRPKYYHQWNVVRLMTGLEMSRNPKVKAANADKNIEKMFAEASKELEAGVAITADLVVAIGTKSFEG